MPKWRSIVDWRPWRFRQHREADLDRELRSHLDLEAERLESEGMSANDARHAARRALGNTTLIKEEVREMWGWTTLEQVVQDVRYAFRGMRQNRAFTIVAILSLALGIGATTAVFSVLNAVVLRPLPVTEPDRLVILKPERRGDRFVLFNPLFEDLRRSQRSLEGMFAVSDEPYLKAAIDGAPPVYLRGSFVSADYFRVLGLSPALGRLLADDDDDPAVSTCAVVFSHGFWKKRLSGDPSVLGRTMVVRGKVCSIVGVAPAFFNSHEPGYAPDVWLPLRPLTDSKLLASHSMAFFTGVMGRLRPETTPAAAEVELTALYQRMQAAEPQEPKGSGQSPARPNEFRMAVAPGAQGLDTVRREFGQPLALALAVVGLVLMIAATNVANLILARGAARTPELATRVALGAGRARLMRLVVSEGVGLALVGGLLGVVLAVLATPVLSQAVTLPYQPILLDTAPDARVLSFAIATTLFAALVAGVLPALRLSRAAGLQTAMAGPGRSTSTRSGQRLNRTLVAAQLALSIVLVTSAGLLLQTMVRVMAVDPGFNTNNVVLMDIRDTAPSAGFGERETVEQKARRAALYQALDERLNGLPGVQSASVSWLGLFGGSYVGLDVYDIDYPDDRRFTLLDYVSPRYFETMGIRLLRGRWFAATDRESSLPVAVVNEAFVRERIGGGREAIGCRFVWTYQEEQKALTIVGIVHDAKYNDLREPKAEPMMWLPLAQAPFKITSVGLRFQPGNEAAVIRQARAALTAVNRDLMVRKVTTLRDQVNQATARERLLLELASGFGGLALLLAAVGLYGTLAYGVARRTREIGVRLALGAQRAAVMRLVLGESLFLVAVGMCFGVPLSVAAGSLLRTFLFGVSHHDALTLVGACVVLGAVAFIAAFAPARYASRIDPILALRYD